MREQRRQWGAAFVALATGRCRCTAASSVADKRLHALRHVRLILQLHLWLSLRLHPVCAKVFSQYDDRAEATKRFRYISSSANMSNAVT